MEMGEMVDEAIIETICVCGGICDEYFFERYHWYRCTVCKKLFGNENAEEKIKIVRHTFDDGVYLNA